MSNIVRFDPFTEISRLDPFLDIDDVFNRYIMRPMLRGGMEPLLRRGLELEPQIKMDVKEVDG